MSTSLENSPLELWRDMRLSQIGHVISGATPKTANQENWHGRIAWVTPSDLSNLPTRHLSSTERTILETGLANSAAKLSPPLSLVVSSRAPIGNMALPEMSFCTNQGCKSIQFFEGQNPDFHYYNLGFWVQRLHEKGEGTTFSEISKTAMENVVVPVPVDPKVQDAIANVLILVDIAIQGTEYLLTKQQRINTGLLQDLLTSGIDTQGRRRDPSKHEFKQSQFGAIPIEWKPSTVGSECEDVCVGIVIRPSQYYAEQGIIALRSLNVKSGFFDLSKVVRISHEANLTLSKSRLRAGDVVSVRTGEPGTSAVVTKELEGANCIDLVISRPGPRLRPSFFVLWMNSSFGKEHVSRNQGGLAQQHFNVREMRLLPIPLPEPDEQDAIVARAAGVARLVNDLEVNLTKLKRLKTGLMRDLLTGSVPVRSLILESSFRSQQ